MEMLNWELGVGGFSRRVVLFFAVACWTQAAGAAPTGIGIQSPDGRNAISLLAGEGADAPVEFTVVRDGKTLVEPSPLGPVLTDAGALGDSARVVESNRASVDETFTLPWGKTTTVRNHCSTAHVVLETPKALRWEVDLRAYDDGVAFRYRLSRAGGAAGF